MRALPVPAGVEALTRDILARHGESVLAVIFYGSCRRKNDAGEGLSDLLVLVDSYRSVHGAGPAAVANCVLPPNVYYLETDASRTRPALPSSQRGLGRFSPIGERSHSGVPSRGRKYRSKYAIISIAAFERRCRHGLDGYFWARFAQPAQLAFARDDAVGRRLAAARAGAAARFASRAAGLFDGEMSGRDFWIRSLQASYRCELRPERPQAAERLVEADADYYAELASHLLPALAHVDAHDARYRLRPSGLRRLGARTEWFLRRIWGKTLNLARLFKAAGTFSGGIDYLLWKVERHSGVHVEATPFMRRHPRLAAFGLAWRLRRQGAFK